MKTSILFVALLALPALFAGNDINALLPQGNAVTLPLAGLRIVIPAEPTAPESYAAQRLQAVLEAMADHAIPIWNESEVNVPSPAIYLGSGGAEAGMEGYAIHYDNGALRLTGDAAHGPVNAVLALLEEDLNWRWYSPYVAERLPGVQTTIEVVPRTYTPRLRIRDPYYFESRLNLEWSGSNRISPINIELPAHFGPTHCYVPHLFCHTLPRIMAYYDAQEQLLTTHPEMFALVNGERRGAPYNPCLTNPDTLELIVNDVLSAIAARPNCEIISVSQGDGVGMFCQCDACAAVIAREGESGLMLQFVNAVARRIRSAHPAVRISTLAYNETVQPPPGVRPESNVAIQLTDEKYIAAWSAIAPEIYLWYNWPVCYKNLLLPVSGLPLAREKISRMAAQPSARGIMFLGDYQSPGASLAPLYTWVLAKQLWDERRDTDALVEDFCHGYYGNAAAPMLAYAQLIFDSGIPAEHVCGTWDGYSGCPNRPRLSREQLSRAGQLLQEAKVLAASTPAILLEVEREELSWLYARLDAGVRDSADIPAYQGDLERFTELAARYQVTHVNELEREMTLEQQLQQWRGNIAIAK